MIVSLLPVQFWVCGVFQSAQQTNHAVTRLLGFLRSVQSDSARRGCTGDPITIKQRPNNERQARLHQAQRATIRPLLLLGDDCLNQCKTGGVCNDPAGKGAVVRMMICVAVPAVLMLALFWLAPTTPDVHLSMTLPILIPFRVLLAYAQQSMAPSYVGRAQPRPRARRRTRPQARRPHPPGIRQSLRPATQGLTLSNAVAFRRVRRTPVSNRPGSVALL